MMGLILKSQQLQFANINPSSTLRGHKSIAKRLMEDIFSLWNSQVNKSLKPLDLLTRQQP